MFKKHMTPLQPHSKKGDLHVSSNKASAQKPGMGAMGGMPNFGSYAKQTPMADQPAPEPDGIGSGSFGGIATG